MTKCLSPLLLAILLSCSETGAGTKGLVYEESATQDQDEACAAALAEGTDASIGEVTVWARDTAPSGNAVITVETGEYRATCEVDERSNVVAFDLLE